VTAVPPGLAHLPVCPVRGLPIPYSSGRDPAGTGRFGVNDPAAKLACGLLRLCGVCGRPLGGGEIVFLAQAAQVPHRPVFTDPPMHEACAGAAMSLCPRIARPRAAGRPWLMWVTTAYELVPGRKAAADFRPGPFTRLRLFTYRPDLTEVTP
jgi:hypothetical protein